MRLELDGKVALVAGGSRGLGLEIAGVLREEGCRVLISARTAPPAEFEFLQADMQDPVQCGALARKLERLEENIGAVAIELTTNDLNEIEHAMSQIKVVGNRY